MEVLALARGLISRGHSHILSVLFEPCVEAYYRLGNIIGYKSDYDESQYYDFAHGSAVFLFHSIID